MSVSLPQSGAFCLRRLAVCLVWVLAWTVWPSSVEATCGDYLMPFGQTHQSDNAPQTSLGRLTGTQHHGLPSGCPNGNCHSQEQTPEPVGSTVDNRIVDDIRSFGWLNGFNSQNQKSSGDRSHPADELLPESPFNAELERPPQTSSV